MAFAKALKDDFVHARVAGLMAFMACIDCFDIEELAGRVVGVVAGALVDKEKYVLYHSWLARSLSHDALSQARTRSGIQGYRVVHEEDRSPRSDDGECLSALTE